MNRDKEGVFPPSGRLTFENRTDYWENGREGE